MNNNNFAQLHLINKHIGKQSATQKFCEDAWLYDSISVLGPYFDVVPVRGNGESFMDNVVREKILKEDIVWFNSFFV